MTRFVAICRLDGHEPGQFVSTGHFDEFDRPVMKAVKKVWMPGTIFESDDQAEIDRLTDLGAIRPAEEGE